MPVLPHYLGVVLDPTSVLGECSESNNAALFPDPVRINALAQVDVAVTNLEYHPRVVTAGSPIKVDLGIENRGTSAATSFQLGVVLSPDAEVSVEGVASGRDLVVDRFTVPVLPAGEARSAIRDVVIPAGLDHLVPSWHVAVLADLDGFLTADIDPANNARISANTLTVSGASGGCFEDQNEPNDTRAGARILSVGASARIDALGACGNDDWFIVDVPAGRSLFATVTARAIESVNGTPSEPESARSATTSSACSVTTSTRWRRASRSANESGRSSAATSPRTSPGSCSPRARSERAAASCAT